MRMRCKADLHIHVVSTGLRLELHPGQEVEIDQVLAPGHTLADAIRGREDCFELVNDADMPASEESR